MPIKVVNDHAKGLNESHTMSVQEKLLPLPEEQLQVISGSGPIEIRIYEDQVSDSGPMMLKISVADRGLRNFVKR